MTDLKVKQLDALGKELERLYQRLEELEQII